MKKVASLCNITNYARYNTNNWRDFYNTMKTNWFTKTPPVCDFAVKLTKVIENPDSSKVII